MKSRAALYSATGEALTHYEMNGENATLVKRGTVLLPANVQYAWPHPFFKRWQITRIHCRSCVYPRILSLIGRVHED
jgi:hypothetical protein